MKKVHQPYKLTFILLQYQLHLTSHKYLLKTMLLYKFQIALSNLDLVLQVNRITIFSIIHLRETQLSNQSINRQRERVGKQTQGCIQLDCFDSLNESQVSRFRSRKYILNTNWHKKHFNNILKILLLYKYNQICIFYLLTTSMQIAECY